MNRLKLFQEYHHSGINKYTLISIILISNLKTVHCSEVGLALLNSMTVTIFHTFSLKWDTW